MYLSLEQKFANTRVEALLRHACGGRVLAPNAIFEFAFLASSTSYEIDALTLASYARSGFDTMSRWIPANSRRIGAAESRFVLTPNIVVRTLHIASLSGDVLLEVGIGLTGSERALNKLIDELLMPIRSYLADLPLVTAVTEVAS